MRAAILLIVSPLALAACAPRLSPDSYATRAVQQMNPVEQGVVIGRRSVLVEAAGETGAATGGAAGGIIGSQAPGGNMAGAIGAVGGALVGGLLGTTAERVAGSAPAYEYIVRKGNGELVSVTQRDQTPLDIGERVLVIAGTQARIVPDYTAPVEPPAAVNATPRVPPAPTASPAPASPAPTAPAPAAPAAAPGAMPPGDIPPAVIPPAVIPPDVMPPAGPAAEPLATTP